MTENAKSRRGTRKVPPLDGVTRVRASHYLDPRLLSLLDKQAKKEDRSRASLIEIMIREGLIKRGAADPLS